ncbi:MAG: family 78 glycoside hydrolase catalytic domain, partial [Candidatus Hydrogenedentes bacterium]|nr:family 78 glycoside hydrolase catalytic domain [Candidatus Hydrogenedentota bacterium]
WDRAGNPSPWSDTATWTMGLLEASDWQAKWLAGRAPRPALEGAQWIWASDEDFMQAAPGARFFCKTFDLASKSEIHSAKLEISVDNECAVRIGNREVTTKRGWERAEIIDVTSDVHVGSNFIGLDVTNTTDNPNPAGVIARLDVVFADGSSQTLVTDKSWRAGPKKGWDLTLKLNRFEKDPTADWPNAEELGPCGIEPWSGITRVGSDVMPIFRKQFGVEQKPVKRALAFVCGLGHFELSINGAKVGDHVIDPGWTDYKDTCLYVPFDVTEMLQAGPNALGIMLGNGMYNVTGGRYVKFLGSFGEPKLILHLRVEYEDGTVQRVVSDDSWKTDNGPIVFSCVYGGEDYDARREQPGWDTPGFDDSEWEPVRVVDGPGGTLRPQSAPPITVTKTIHADSIGRISSGQYLVDLGENLSARPFMTVTGPAGARVTITTGELIDKPWEGHSYTYTLKGQGEETFRSRFTYFGFQYLQVEGVDLPDDAETGKERAVLLDVGADFVTSSAPAVGAFHCAEPMPDMTHLFNDIDAMINRSVRSNLQSVLTDCPHREKLGWLEVAHLMGPSILYRYDAYGLYRKICRDSTDSHLDNGLVPDIAPEYTRFNGGFFESAEWGSASVQLPWLLYRWYGDEEVLAEQYDTMARYTRYLATTRNEQGLAKAGLGDWYDWTPEHG